MNNTDNLELASIFKRFLAFFIDEILVTVLLYFVFWDSLVTNAADANQLANALAGLVVPVLVIKLIYQTFFVWYYGATIGKIILKIRVIDYNHFGRVSFQTSLVRSIARLVSEYFIYIGFAVAFLTEGKQAFHDKLGKTLVVNA